MTDNGTFVINGTERAVVSQLHRSPGFFSITIRERVISAGSLYFLRALFPIEGPGLILSLILKTSFMFRIDRRRKFPVTVFLKALGYSEEALLNYYYPSEEILLEGDKFYSGISA